jgi:hypothetical protein
VTASPRGCGIFTEVVATARRCCAGCVFGLSFACGTPQAEAPPPPPAPALGEPALAMPSDLDLVVRVDMRRLRGALGAGFDTIFEETIARARGDERDAETGRLLLLLLSRADTVWLGARPGHSPSLTDNVLVLRGAFGGLVPDAIGGEPPWERPERLGGAVLRYGRRTQPMSRAAPAVLYLREPDLAVLGSAAEIDALALTVEEGRGAAPLRAPEAGIVAVSARVPVLGQRLRQRAPTVARLFEGATRVSATCDRKQADFEFGIDLEYGTAERVAEVAEPIRQVLAVLARSGFGFLEQARVDAVGASIGIRFALSAAELERRFACWVTSDCGAPVNPPPDVLPSAPP